MLNPKHFRNFVIDPTLQFLGLYSEAASDLLLGTAIVESRLTYLKQINGPALGLYQIEPATHKDVFMNYLDYRHDLHEKVLNVMSANACIQDTPDNELITNLAYATAIARIIYLRVPKPLPEAGDWKAIGRYWKEHYNTFKGAGTAEKFVSEVLTAQDNYGL